MRDNSVVITELQKILLSSVVLGFLYLPTKDELKKVYKVLVKEYHPDTYLNPSQDLKYVGIINQEKEVDTQTRISIFQTITTCYKYLQTYLDKLVEIPTMVSEDLLEEVPYHVTTKTYYVYKDTVIDLSEFVLTPINFTQLLFNTSKDRSSYENKVHQVNKVIQYIEKEKWVIPQNTLTTLQYLGNFLIEN